MSRVYNNILWFGLATILVFSPIARGATRMWSITPVLLISYFLIFLWLFKINNQTASYKPQATKLDIPIFLFAILAVISFIFSIYRHDSLYALLRIFGYIGIYYLVVNEFDHSMRNKLIWIAIAIATAISLYGILQYLGILGHSWWNPKEFLAATFVNHNHFAGYLELVMPAAIAMLISRRSSLSLARLLLSVLLTIMLAAFILAQSRGAWISLSVSLFAMFFIMSKKGTRNKKRFFILVFIVVLIASIMYFGKEVITERVETMTETGSEDPSFATRLKIWQGTAGMIRENPIIGVGIGDFDAGFNKYRPEGLNVRAVYAHNEYLHMIAEMGILAPFLMFWIFAIVIATGLKSTNPYALGCSVGVLSLALHGFVDFNFHIPANMILFVIWCAIVIREKD